MRKTRTMTLGEFIRELKKARPDQEIYFDFCSFTPIYIDSWRGSYNELAITYDNSEPRKVQDVIDFCEAANGKIFTGYKGGEYKMSFNTPVWVDNYGESSETAIVDLIDDGWRIIIETRYIKYQL